MFCDLAVRDLEMAIGAFALSQLSAVRERSSFLDGVLQPEKSRLTAAR